MMAAVESNTAVQKSMKKRPISTGLNPLDQFDQWLDTFFPRSWMQRFRRDRRDLEPQRARRDSCDVV